MEYKNRKGNVNANFYIFLKFLLKALPLKAWISERKADSHVFPDHSGLLHRKNLNSSGLMSLLHFLMGSWRDKLITHPPTL